MFTLYFTYIYIQKDSSPIVNSESNSKKKVVCALVKSVVQYYFLRRIDLTKMANIIVQNHGEHQNKDFGTRPVYKFQFKVMVWVEWNHFSSSYLHRHFALKKHHLMRLFTSKIYYQ